jgi:monofunctional biosynthetic peptidoglycan transglycosylase
MSISARGVGRGFIACAAAAFAYFCYLYLTLPDVRQLRSANPSSTAFMELRDEEARDQDKEPKRVQRWVAYNRISPSLTRAVLVAEDAAFWQHEGVDFDELQRSIELDWARGQLVRGASTITQQLAKNLYLSPSRNPIRKLRELIIARRLEGELTKARILELYLNVIEWGDGIYGVEAASRAYFGTSASRLGPSQAALLAGAIINPRVLNPGHPTARLARRQQLILSRMGAVTPPSDTPPPQPENAPPAPEPTTSDPPAIESLPLEPWAPEPPAEPPPAEPPAPPAEPPVENSPTA